MWLSSSRPLAAPMAFAAVLLLPLLASAQEEEGGEGESAEPYRDCSEEALAEVDTTETLSGSPANTRILPSGLTPEEAEAFRQRILEVKLRQIQDLQTMLADMPADYPRRSDLVFRMAEAYWEVSDAQYMADRATYNQCYDDWMMCRRDDLCTEPVPDYSQALDRYREILRDDPSYERIDEVIFRLGDGLIQADQAAEGVQYLTRLTNNYPDSRYIPDARFLMGEHYFDNDLLIAARSNYEEVLQFTESDYYNFSIYKLAWIDINEGDYRTSIRRFQEVVDNLDRQERAGQEVRFDLRDQAVNDMLVSWTEIDDGWIEARTYLREHEGEDIMRRKLLAMADLYDEKGKDEERIAVLDWMLGSYPSDPLAPQWMEQIADSLTKIGDWNRYEARVREFVQDLDPNGTWAIQNSENERAMANARIFSEQAFLGVISRNYQEAERLNRQDLYEEVAQDYEEFFRRFPDSQEAYDQRFFWAEVLYYHIEDYPRAGEVYLDVVHSDPEGEHAHDAIIGALQAYDDLMETEVPDIDEERQIMSQTDLEALRAQGVEEQELGPWSQRYVEVVEEFAELYPDDERIPVASWRAAELFRRANRIGDAARRFETIIEHHPTHRFAEEAAISAFLCYQYVEDWERIEYWARFLLEHNPDPENTDLNPERLRGAIAYAINEQSQDLIEEGEEFAAAEMMIGLYREFPESQFSPNALFNAAAIYERARRVETAVDTYRTFLEAYPENELVPEALNTLGLIFDSQAQFAEAADWFERVEAFPDYDGLSDAVFTAGRLREALSEFDTAIAHYDRFIELEPDDSTIPNVVLLIADIEQRRGNLDAAYQRYQWLRDNFESRAALQLLSTVRQANIREEQGNAQAALDLYESAYEQYGPGVLTFDPETGLPLEWERPAGWRFEDPEEQTIALPYAAQARFKLADVAFEQTQAISLAYPEGRWRVLSQNLQERGESLTGSQQMMFEVVQMGDAAWSVAAWTRIGELYKKFYDDMYNLPQPDLDECYDRYNPDDCDQLDDAYNTMLYEMMYPIETKARDSFTEALRIAHDNVVYTDWTARAVALVADIDRSIRIVGEEGVEPDHVGQLYSSIDMIVDLTEKLERQRILEEERAAALAAQQRGGAAPTPAPDDDAEGEGDDVPDDGGGGGSDGDGNGGEEAP